MPEAQAPVTTCLLIHILRGKSFYLDKLYFPAPLHRDGSRELLPAGEAPTHSAALICFRLSFAYSLLAGLSYLLQMKAKGSASTVW